jgi:antitoxin component YwqK of YwqJK toxin-antitoxin module
MPLEETGAHQWDNRVVTDDIPADFTGEATESFADGKRSAEGTYVDGKKNGQWISYNRAGGIRAIGDFVDGEMHGPWEWFREGGSMMRSGHFDMGVQTGEWITWTVSGEAATRKNFT